MKPRNKQYLQQQKSKDKQPTPSPQPRPGGADMELPVAPVEEPQMNPAPVEGKKG
jgi:hypothetical protein